MGSFGFTAEDVERELGWTHVDRRHGTGFHDQNGELRTWYDAKKAMPDTSPVPGQRTPQTSPESRE